MDETTETTNRCPEHLYGQRCHYTEGHTGAHRSEHVDWPQTTKYCAADAGEGGCVRRAGHAGEHAWRTVTAQALDRGEEWPPVPCGAPIQGTSDNYVVAGHIGSHQHLPVDTEQDADRPELPVRERRGVTVAALTRLRRELREELQHKLGTLESGVNERLEALEKSMGSREDHLSLHHTLEVGLYSALGEVERRMTALEARFGRMAEDKWRAVAEDKWRAVAEQVTETSIPYTVTCGDGSEWDRRLGTLEKRADQVLERVNKAEYRILRAVESLRAEPMEHARGTVTCDAVGQWRPPTGSDPVAVVCQRAAGHEGGCEDRGMTWSALCADGSGEPWCTQRNGHDGECDPDPMAQVPNGL